MPNPGNTAARRVLQVGPLKQSLAETLRTSYAAYVLPDDGDREAFLAEHADEITVAVTSGRTGVDAALVDALTAGRLAGAGLDVFADEPRVPAALLAMDNVVLLPHVASGTVQTRAAMEELTLRNVDTFLRSGQLVTPVAMPLAAPGGRMS